MSFTSFISSLFDDAFSPACAHDSCSSGFVDMGSSDSSSSISTSSTDDWTNAFGTQADFQPAAEAFTDFQAGTFDAFDSSPSFDSFNSFD